MVCLRIEELTMLGLGNFYLALIPARFPLSLFTISHYT